MYPEHTPYSMDIDPNPTRAAQLRVLSGATPAVVCMSPMSMGVNVGFCNQIAVIAGSQGCPIGGSSCHAICAVALMVATTPSPKSCQLACTPCGVQTILNSDGLPVELMDFYIGETTDPENSETQKPAALGGLGRATRPNSGPHDLPWSVEARPAIPPVCSPAESYCV